MHPDQEPIEKVTARLNATYAQTKLQQAMIDDGFFQPEYADGGFHKKRPGPEPAKGTEPGRLVWE